MELKGVKKEGQIITCESKTDIVLFWALLYFEGDISQDNKLGLFNKMINNYQGKSVSFMFKKGTWESIKEEYKDAIKFSCIDFPELSQQEKDSIFTKIDTDAFEHFNVEDIQNESKKIIAILGLHELKVAMKELLIENGKNAENCGLNIMIQK